MLIIWQASADYRLRMIAVLFFVLAGAISSFAAEDQPLNDYPTVARADYVFGCMTANGQTRDTLERCSCSIDLIASILPYEKYVKAETVLRMEQVGGEKTAMFNSSPAMRTMVDDLRRAQAEAEVRCF